MSALEAGLDLRTYKYIMTGPGTDNLQQAQGQWTAAEQCPACHWETTAKASG